MKTTLPFCFAKSTTLAVILGLTLTGGFLRAEDDAALLGNVKVATAAGKTVELIVNGKTGAVSK